MKTSIRVSVFVMMLCVASAFSQNNSPSVEQCRGDQHLWFDQLTNQPEEISKLPFHKLTDRLHEMNQCSLSDKDQWQSYSSTAFMLEVLQATRLLHFLERHGQTRQFLAEDAAGKR